MHDIEVVADNTVTIDTGDMLKVEVGLDNVSVNTENSAIVNVEPNEYYLTSSGMYTGRLTGSIPSWLHNAIQQELTVGEGNLLGVVDDLRRLVDTLQLGVEQNITQIETNNISLSALETSVVSRLNRNDAAILNVESTKVTQDEAQAIALNLQQSTFGSDAEAYITSLAATYTDINSALAQDMDLLVASVGDVTASITELSVVSVDEGQARAKHSLVVNADGNISGYVAESGVTSSFEILADTFKISNGTTKLPVFTVDTANQKAYFTAEVEFEGLGINGGSTTIDGGKITTNTLQADRLLAGTSSATVWDGGGLISTNFNGNSYGVIGTPTQGFRLSSNAAGTSEDPSIYGAYIKSATIEAAVIDSTSNITAPLLYVNRIMVASPTVGNFGQIYYINNPIIMPQGSSDIQDTVDVFGHSYGSGYLANRVCNQGVSSKVEISLSASWTNTYAASSITIQRSIDSGVTWTTFYTATMDDGTIAIVDTSLPSNFVKVRYRATSDLSSLRTLQVRIYN